MSSEASKPGEARPRYAYVKNGDAVDQASRILGQGAAPVPSGPEAFVSDLLNHLAEAQLLVLSRFRSNAEFRYRDVVVKVMDGGASRVGKLIRKPLVFFWIIAQLLAFKPDQILCGCVGSRLWATVLAAKLLRVPVVYSGHNRVQDDADTTFRGFKARIDRLALNFVDGAVCHGPYLKAELDRMKLPGVPTAFEFDVAIEVPEHTVAAAAGGHACGADGGAANRIPRILFVGRLEHEKGILDLLDACDGLLRSGCATLDYVGGGRAEGALRARIAAQGLDGQVSLLGTLPHEQVLTLMGGTAAVVTPSRPDFPEGRCMAALEALALGVPVVAPDYGPFPYLVSHDANGLLFQAGRVDALRQALERMFRQPGELARLTEGAAAMAPHFRSPPRTFAQAVESAFAAAGGK